MAEEKLLSSFLACCLDPIQQHIRCSNSIVMVAIGMSKPQLFTY